MRIFPIIALCVLGFTGCASYPQKFDGDRWQEEVRLKDGKMILVERATVPGAIRRSTTGSAFYRTEQTLKLPDGIVWRSTDLNTFSVSLIPLILDHDGGSWTIVATTSSYGEYLRLGCPVPNFLYLRLVKGEWIRVRDTDISENLQFNLLQLRRLKSPIASLVTVVEKDKLNSEWYAEEKLEDEKSYRAHRGYLYSWMDPLSYLVRFSKFCDPKISECKQLRHPTKKEELHPQCDPSYLVLPPK
jgi:hypothetical protein